MLIILNLKSIKHKVANGLNNKEASKSEDIKNGKVKASQSKKTLNEKIKKDRKEINQLVMNWQNTFGNLKNWNQEKNGLTLSHIEVHDYGISARIYAPWGMDLHDLDKKSSLIETGCKCEFLYSIPQHRQFATAKFIYPEQVKINEWEFSPIKVKPWEFCPGYDVSGEPIIFNINDTPHILLAGQQRRGKNGAVDHAIISWIHSCDEKEITFYLFQCAKNDLIKYRDCKQVYCYADTLNNILIALEHLEKELQRRTKLFQPMIAKADGNDNIFHYNKIHKNNKLPYIIVIIDEFIELMPDPSVDSKEIKDIKNKIMKHLQQIGQFGGSMGINYCPLHQKPSAVLMPPFIKNQSSVRISFGFEDLVCCSIVLGDELAKYAHKLPPRKAYYSNNESNGYLYTPNLKGRIRMFIEPSIVTNHRTLFTDLEKLNTKPLVTNTNTEEVMQPIKDQGIAPLPKNIKIPKIDLIESLISKEIPKIINIEKVIPNIETKAEPKKIKQPKPNIPSIKSMPLEFNEVDPIILKENKLTECIKLIPNFVPYVPIQNEIIKNYKE